MFLCEIGLQEVGKGWKNGFFIRDLVVNVMDKTGWLVKSLTISGSKND